MLTNDVSNAPSSSEKLRCRPLLINIRARVAMTDDTIRNHVTMLTVLPGVAEGLVLLIVAVSIHRIACLEIFLPDLDN